MKIQSLLIAIAVSASALTFGQTPNTSDTTMAGKKVAQEQNIISSQKLKLTGYTQPRFQYFQDTLKTSTFDIRRARLALTGAMHEKIDYRLFVEFGGSVPPQLLEAIFSYKFDEKLKFSVGQMLVPLGNDIIASETKMESVNRVLLSEYLGARGNDVIGNQNARDVGATFSGILKKASTRPILNYTVGVFNGTGINRMDNNKDKAIAGRVIVSPVKNLWLGGSYYNGSSRWGDSILIDKNRDRFGFELEYTYKRITLRSEYLQGEDDTISRYGYYVQLIGDIIQSKFQLSGRVEYFDFNKGVQDDAVYLLTICPSYLWGERARVQIGYDIVREESVAQKKNDVAQVQFQLAF